MPRGPESLSRDTELDCLFLHNFRTIGTELLLGDQAARGYFIRGSLSFSH